MKKQQCLKFLTTRVFFTGVPQRPNPCLQNVYKKPHLEAHSVQVVTLQFQVNYLQVIINARFCQISSNISTPFSIISSIENVWLIVAKLNVFQTGITIVSRSVIACKSRRYFLQFCCLKNRWSSQLYQVLLKKICLCALCEVLQDHPRQQQQKLQLICSSEFQKLIHQPLACFVAINKSVLIATSFEFS